MGIAVTPLKRGTRRLVEHRISPAELHATRLEARELVMEAAGRMYDNMISLGPITGVLTISLDTKEGS